MDHSEPKTRQERKGRDKDRGGGPYSQKHIRLQEALREKRSAEPKTGSKSGSKR